ncbi:MAG: type II secretion system protein [Tissierellales bacterium]|nr:type II secretion system protein [Tissierellales bacterium]
MNKLKNKKGFTLIELIVVLAVLGIIAAIAIPRFLTVQAQARIDADYATAAGVAKAAELWYVQVGAAASDTTPDMTDLANYVDNPGEFQSDEFTWPVVISVDTSTGVATVTDSTATTALVMYPYPASPVTP